MKEVRQAGGHQLIKSCKKFIFKPTKPSEVKFYVEYLPNFPKLVPHVPKIYDFGETLNIKNIFKSSEYSTIVSNNYRSYIKLENLIHDLNNYQMIDIKLGHVLWKSTTPKEKIEYSIQKNKNSILSSHHYRIDGMFLNSGTYDKETCRNLRVDEVKHHLGNLDTKIKKNICEWIEEIIPIIRSIPICFYGLSMFIIMTEESVVCKLIDFTKYEEMKDEIRLDDTVEALESVKKTLTENF